MPKPGKGNTRKFAVQYHPSTCKNPKQSISRWSPKVPRHSTSFTDKSLVIANTLFQQQKRRLYTWTSPDGQHWNWIDYILCSQRWRGSIQSAKTRPQADCGSDHELLIAKFRLTLKKVGKTFRPFRYDLNQIPYDYTVEVYIYSG